MAPQADRLELIVTGCFFGTWIILGVVTYFLFIRGDDPAFKRRWFPRLVVLVGVLFVAFSGLLSVLSSRSLDGLRMLAITVPAVVLISVANIKLTKFCDACGTTVFRNTLTPARFCPKCGAPLDPKPKPPDDPLA